MFVQLSYDAAHRLSRKTLSGGEIIDYCYDGKVYLGTACGDLSNRTSDGADYPKGRLTGVGSAGGWTNHLQVDALGRTLKLEQRAADLTEKTLEYTYATNGFVKTMKYPSGRIVSYAQSAAGRTLSATGSNGEGYASGLQYGANGALVGAVWNGTGATRLVESRVYNWLGQLSSLDVLKAGTDRKWKITNEYGDVNNNGNLNKQWTETGLATYGVKFIYDSVNRIRGAVEDSANESQLPTQACATVGGTWCVKYRADGYGNLWTENKSANAAGVAAMSQAAYDASTNRLTGAGYYSNGNQKHFVLNENKSRAEYDAEGRMTKAGWMLSANGLTDWDTSKVATVMTYNGAGQRVKKTVTQGAATQTCHYVYGLDGELAAEWSSVSSGVTGRQFLLSDHLGSTRVRLDENGEVLQRMDYEPFGTEVQRTASGYTGSGEVKQKFTGKERDAETGFDYFGARYMSAALGRFTTPDPLLNSGRPWDPRSWNRYSYTLSSPMIFVDPDGLYEWGTCNGTEDQCKQARADFEKALEDAKAASKNLKNKDNQSAVDKALESIGKLGEKNFVYVNFNFQSGTADTQQAGASTVIKGDNGRLLRIEHIAININPIFVKETAAGEQVDYRATFAQLVAHEGVHIPQARAENRQPKNFDEYYRREFPAFLVGSYVNEGLNQNAPYGLWNTSWANASDKEARRTEAITNVIANFGVSLKGAPTRGRQ